MTINRYLRAYRTQKHGASARGIEFLLTFKEWCDFWGDDIDRRGNGQFDLQMQRFADTGPYAIWNIRKGTPKQNMVTAGHMKRKRATDRCHKELQEELDRAIYEESLQLDEQPDDDGMPNLGIHSSMEKRYTHALSKKYF